jgi:uncharacterized membrane-anchored protein YjiN (DUF445 family)
MTRRNPIGTLSLLGTSAGFAVMEALRHAGLPFGPGLHILQAGFEAGMVGGCADWFAVSALFRPIPCRRFAIPHTNLIVKERRTLTGGIVDMVQNQWLSPASLAQKLQGLRASQLLLEDLATPGARHQVAGAARDLLGRLAGTLNAPELAGFLDRALRDQLAGLDLAPAVGGWLQARVQGGDANALWDFLTGSLAASAEAGDFNQVIGQMLQRALESYQDRGALAWLKGKALELAFDVDDVSGSLAVAFARSLRQIQQDPAHPLRAKLDEQLLGFAQQLVRGDPDACAAFTQFQQRLTEHAELGPLLARILSRLQETLQTQLASADSDLAGLLDRLLDNLLTGLRGEPHTQDLLDAWVRRTLLDLAARHHDQIGALVAGNLAKLSDDDLVAQVEGQVGNHLQFIRLNGALVGSLVGMALAGLKLLLG